MKRIYIGTLGESSEVLKNSLIDFVKDSYEVVDVDDADNATQKSGVDVAQAVSSDANAVGIVLCGNGFGIAKDASIHEDITVINCISVSQAMSGREVNDANVLAIGSRMVSDDVAKDIVSAFLSH